jgi:hypothetical protein
MKALLFLLLAFCLTNCATERKWVPIAELPSYGDALPGTIHVVALSGFVRLGHYHLPEGAKLGLLLDLADLEPVEARLLNVSWCWNYVAISKQNFTKPRVRATRHNGVVSAKDRNLRLQDGDFVFASEISL